MRPWVEWWSQHAEDDGTAEVNFGGNKQRVNLTGFIRRWRGDLEKTTGDSLLKSLHQLPPCLPRPPTNQGAGRRQLP